MSPTPEADPTPEAPEADPAGAEAAALLEAIRAPEPPAEPSGPTPLDIGKAACARVGCDPHKRAAELTEAGARAVRRTLGMPEGAEVSNLDRYTAAALEVRAEARWRQLDERAAAEGWRTAPFATLQRLGKTDDEYNTWALGRARYDPNPPPPPTFGTRPWNPPAPRQRDGAAMDAAIREAAIAARQQVREVEITGDGITPRL